MRHASNEERALAVGAGTDSRELSVDPKDRNSDPAHPKKRSRPGAKPWAAEEWRIASYDFRFFRIRKRATIPVARTSRLWRRLREATIWNRATIAAKTRVDDGARQTKFGVQLILTKRDSTAGANALRDLAGRASAFLYSGLVISRRMNPTIHLRAFCKLVRRVYGMVRGPESAILLLLLRFAIPGPSGS